MSVFFNAQSLNSQPSPLAGEGARRAGEGASNNEPLSHHCCAMVPPLPQGERVVGKQGETADNSFLLPLREKVARLRRMRGRFL